MREKQREQKITACRVTVIEGIGYDVTSPSGNTYRVSTEMRRDQVGSIYFTRHCDCPARGDCVHMAAVERHQWATVGEGGDEYTDVEFLERYR